MKKFLENTNYENWFKRNIKQPTLYQLNKLNVLLKILKSEDISGP